MPYKDPQKQKEFLCAYHKDYHQTRYKNRQREMLNYLGGVCVVCGTDQELEFDHIDPSVKSFSITRLWNRKWDVLQPELDKCQLLCKMDHYKKTYMR